MRYAQGGGLTAEGRRRRERVRLEAVDRFEQRVPSAMVAVELRVSERSVRRWRRGREEGGRGGGGSRGAGGRGRGGGGGPGPAGGGAGGGGAGARGAGPAGGAGAGPRPGHQEVRGAVHRAGDLVPAATARLVVPDGRAPRDRA